MPAKRASLHSFSRCIKKLVWQTSQARISDELVESGEHASAAAPMMAANAVAERRAAARPSSRATMATASYDCAADAMRGEEQLYEN